MADDVVAHAQPHIERIIDDFDGHDLDVEWTDRQAQFSFKILAFRIHGRLVVDERQIAIDVDLPLVAMMFKDRVEESLRKNLTEAIAEAGAE